MLQQWFLDLDGAKSGPYQTQEVLALILEGEILPHHRIAPTLRDPKWLSILDWKLEQSKLTQGSTAPLEAQETQKPITPQLEPRIEIVPVVEEVSETPVAATPPPPPHIQITPANDAPPNQKRDPMAEMFDMLQKTKQKREEKQIQSAQAASAYSATKAAKERSGSSFLEAHWKTIAMGLGITLIGFWLGQWFQQSAPPQSIALATPTPLPIATATPEQKASPEYVDRSTEKMVIRSRAAATHPETNHQAARPNEVPNAPTDPKDLKELQDLKKELLELKNLKEELKNSINSGEEDFQDPNGGNYMDENAPPGSQPMDLQPSSQPGQNPRQINDPNLHY